MMEHATVWGKRPNARAASTAAQADGPDFAPKSRLPSGKQPVLSAGIFPRHFSQKKRP